MSLTLSGVFAALITPIDSHGRVDFSRLDRLIDFVMARGVDGLCIGGGTSEYPHFDLDERREMLTRAADRLGRDGRLVSAVGASSFLQVNALAEHAVSVDSDALLVPPPHFYPYEQGDLFTFYRTVARSAAVPCLIYHLPAFTQPLEPSTIDPLLTDVPNIAGIKDSSGDHGALDRLENLRSDGRRFNLLCGADELFLPALQAGWDGSISGLASCCPELLTAVYRRFRSDDIEGARRAHELLHEFAGQILSLPFPWGIRTAAAVRGLDNGPLSQPLSTRREEQIVELRRWLCDWFDAHLSELAEDG